MKTLYTCVCSADAGRFIVCGYSNTTLQCGSGQVIVIDGGFYGRKNIYHCRSGQSWVAAPTRAQCGWVDVTKSLTGTIKAGSRISLKCNPDLFGLDVMQLPSSEVLSVGRGTYWTFEPVVRSCVHLTCSNHDKTNILNLIKRFCVDENSSL